MNKNNFLPIMANLSCSVMFLLLVNSTLIFNVICSNDSVAMQKLASALSPTPHGWSNVSYGTDYCTWDGVQCDPSKRVIGIYLANRNLSGTLPFELSTLSQLQNLSFEGNLLSGPIPSFANLSFLREVNLGDNHFERMPEGCFRGLTSLQVFNLSQNTDMDPWTLPTDLAQCTQLVVFEAIDNSITDSIPDVFSSLGKLRDFKISKNDLVGNLPPSFANSTIQNLWINEQSRGLSGNIHVLSSMTELREVGLDFNEFTGQIPDLSNCKHLSILQLGNNRLTGSVPTSLVCHQGLRNVSLNDNLLQGPFPDFPSNVTVDASHNKFCQDTVGTPCGPQATTLLSIASPLHYPFVLARAWAGNRTCQWDFVNCDNQKRVIAMNLARNNFSGTISADFANLTSLRSVMLNDNGLMGPIPDSLAKLSELRFLDVSNNNLSGKVPQFVSLVEVITAGNRLLRVDVDHHSKNETKPDGKSTGRKVSPFMIVGITIAIFLISIIPFVLIKQNKRFLTSVKDKDQKTGGVLSELHGCGSNYGGQGQILFSMEVLQKATDNFSDKNILGRGGCGVVYKGNLDDGKFIAVKRMEATKIGSKEMNGFLAEIKVLTKVRHRHLVALLGYCIRGNENLVVYEFMPQGTLGQHLFCWREGGLTPLTWQQRIGIALDVARGVEYLHSLAQESFIHRDLKPSNILLGYDMRAKVADFGLVKRTVDEMHSTETRVAGTFGYLAPEYAATGKVTRKVDVYAFGVILMEMITGRKAVDTSVSEEGWMLMHLVTWFRGVLRKKEDILNAIDKTLNPDEGTLATIHKVAELAEQCTVPQPHQRPDISHVVTTLVPLVKDWKPLIKEQHENSDTNVPDRLSPESLRSSQADESTSTSCNDMAAFLWQRQIVTKIQQNQM